jgi:CDP-diglyceride synthetase
MPSAMGKLGAPATRLKRSQASLFGGIACGVGVFILVLLLAGGPSPLNIAIGLVIGTALGVWVRLADL